MSALEFHPYANLFPLMEGPELDAFVADIRDKGLHEQIVLHDGKILDGRNRYRALAAIGRDGDPRHFIDFARMLFVNPGEPLDYVLSKNLRRRHLTESRRAMVAARLANMPAHRPSDKSANLRTSQADAAKRLNVSARLVSAARSVQENGTPELTGAVDTGKIAASVAAQAAKLTPEQQHQVVAAAEAGNANVVRTVIKQEARTKREADLGAKQQALPDRKYGVILADPEWEFVVFSKVTGLDRAADNHYSTSSEQTIAARDVQKLAAKDCLLALWTTDLARGIRVMESWGFAFKSYFVWVKDVVEILEDGAGRMFKEVGPAGTGYWNRDRDEILLIGTRGSIPCPAMGTQGESVWFAARPPEVGTARGKHSAKPANAHEWIEKHYPTLPKIELNARQARPGWDCWGHEAPQQEEKTSPPPSPAPARAQELEIPAFLRRQASALEAP